MRWLLLPVFLVSCAGVHRESCTQKDANEIDLWYQRQVAERCAYYGYDTDDCPEMGEIEAEYDRKYDKWVKCGGEK